MVTRNIQWRHAHHVKLAKLYALPDYLLYLTHTHTLSMHRHTLMSRALNHRSNHQLISLLAVLRRLNALVEISAFAAALRWQALQHALRRDYRLGDPLPPGGKAVFE